MKTNSLFREVDKRHTAWPYLVNMDGTGLDAPFQSLAQVGGVHESSFVNENFWLFHLVEKTILLLESRRKGGREGWGREAREGRRKDSDKLNEEK